MTKLKLPGTPPSATRIQAIEVLRRARKLPVGADRNDLRQLAMGLLRLDTRQLEGNGHNETSSSSSVLPAP